MLQLYQRITFLQYVGKPEPGPEVWGPHQGLIYQSPVPLYMPLNPRVLLQAD